MATADSVKAKIQGLIDRSNATTGNTDADLTTAVNSLIAGFGQGGGGENVLDYASDITGLFAGVNFGGGKELTVSFGAKAGSFSANSFKQLFYNAAGLKSVKLIYGGTDSHIVYAGAMFHLWETELEVIDLTQVVDKINISGNAGNVFNGRQGLKEILGEIGFSEVASTDGMFRSCYALENVRFKAGTITVGISFSYSPNLTDETIQSIIDGLADLTSGTAQTLWLHADVGAKLTEEQIASATAKNWTLSY